MNDVFFGYLFGSQFAEEYDSQHVVHDARGHYRLGSRYRGLGRKNLGHVRVVEGVSIATISPSDMSIDGVLFGFPAVSVRDDASRAASGTNQGPYATDGITIRPVGRVVQRSRERETR
jgi:hypothetical protein